MGIIVYWIEAETSQQVKQQYREPVTEVEKTMPTERQIGSQGPLQRKETLRLLRLMAEAKGWDDEVRMIKLMEKRGEPQGLSDQELGGFPAVKWPAHSEQKDGGEFSTFTNADAGDPNREGDDGPCG